MKANYKNWVPKGMVVGLFSATGIAMAKEHSASTLSANNS